LKNIDVAIIGGGHAGCEAALASARLGLKTIMFVLNLDSIAMMPCNPNIGGTSKGHLVREVDALGGEMGKNIDKTFIQSKMLNTARGPAVHSLRAQADKYEYSKQMKKVLENTENLLIKQSEIKEVLVKDKKVIGVVTEDNSIYNCKAVVICTGTYLNSKCLYGEVSLDNGPNGLKSSKELSKSLKKIGINMYRFKTGTPARVDKRTVDFSKMKVEGGDENIVPFSFENTAKDLEREQVDCYLTHTNEKTHKIIQDNINKSPLYSGEITGIGTRYCPSIEDKIVRFAAKDRHQVFVEPEGLDTNEMYVGGLSTSLPESVQLEMYRTVPGLENCEFTRPGYAIEYDCIDATMLKLTLEFKNISGLFSAGQFNGSSGYEEAAAQGLIAGINAGLLCKGEEPLVINRSEGYIGVLIDDLVTKGTKEPYRMMTSRAEYRLVLRQDNADIRLTKKGYMCGLIKEERYKTFLNKIDLVEKEIKRVSTINLSPTEELNKILEENNTAKITTGIKMWDIIKRPEITYDMLQPIDKDRPKLSQEVKLQVQVQIKFEGYIKRQQIQIEQFKKIENKKLPIEFDYNEIKGLRSEAKEKLNKLKPENIGHASRISGVSPSDISVLLVYMERVNKAKLS
jgi:tRNA uridine 5-carboxymethylaminomethyl modification enzyme